MKELIDALVGLAMLAALSGYGPQILFEVKKATLTQIAKGMPSLEKFTEKMTGTKLDF